MHEDSITYPVKLITRVTLLSEHPNPSCLLLIHRHNNRNVPARCERFENTCRCCNFPDGNKWSGSWITTATGDCQGLSLYITTKSA